MFLCVLVLLALLTFIRADKYKGECDELKTALLRAEAAMKDACQRQQRSRSSVNEQVSSRSLHCSSLPLLYVNFQNLQKTQCKSDNGTLTLSYRLPSRGAMSHEVCLPTCLCVCFDQDFVPREIER